MTARSRMMGRKPPRHYDLMSAIWQSARNEPIGLLIRSPEEDTRYYINCLYQTRAFTNDDALFEFKIIPSNALEDGNILLVRKTRGSTTGPNHSADIDVRGILDLDLPED